MKPEAIATAQSRYRIASKALEQLSPAGSEDDFKDSWFVFLTGWKAIYTALEQGSKDSAQSRQWFGGKKAERRGDPLLQYLFEARNDDSHGLTSSVVSKRGGHMFKATEDITEMRVVFDKVGQPSHSIDKDGRVVGEFVQKTPDGPHLAPVTARGSRTIYPPTEHLGVKINVLPIPVARAALDYAAAMIEEAQALRN